MSDAAQKVAAPQTAEDMLKYMPPAIQAQFKRHLISVLAYQISVVASQNKELDDLLELTDQSELEPLSW